MERVKGIEPSSLAWKAIALPIELHPLELRDYTKTNKIVF